MRSWARWAAVCAFLVVHANSQKPAKQVVVTAEEEKVRDAEGYAAIRQLHSQMDDDKSGSIDRSESADFLREDLKVLGNDRTLRENAFHHNDDSITVDDLWEMWFSSPERDWTTADMAVWITNVVRLPQYADNIVQSKSTGISFPRMAIPNSSYITDVLKIKNAVHRQKLQLKALDVVLFGVHDETTLKDVALAILGASFIVLSVVFVSHKKTSHKQLEAMSAQLSELSTMEINFKEESNSSDVEQLREMELQLDARSNYDPSSMLSDLQPLLRVTYERELGYIQMNKAECLEEMKQAREFVDRMRKKQSNLFNSLKLATGATTGTETIDFKIFRERMEKIRNDIAELHNRYAQMENILGMQIMLDGTYLETPLRHQIHNGTPSSSSARLNSLAAQGYFLPTCYSNISACAMTSSSSISSDDAEL